MGKTVLSIDKTKFRINGKLVYEEIAGCNPKFHGMLMNNRFIQGIFDSKNPAQFMRYAKKFDPEVNTNELIAALPEWYDKGLRGLTVGMQGGGSCFSIPGDELLNNPFSADGKTVDPKYLARLDKLITACDELGMIVIVSYFYCHNLQDFDGAAPIINATKTMSTYLKDKKYTNVIIEVANEFNIGPFKTHPIIQNPQAMVALMEIAKDYAGGIPVGCSPGGGALFEEVCKASDVVLIHGNGQSRGRLYELIRKTIEFSPDKPVVINEDSQAIGQLEVCAEFAVSWGYYNNMTKQEPPTYWEITKGEDEFLAWRMADMLGIPQDEIKEEDRYYFQGFEPHMHHDGTRYPRIASLYPESINYVRFYCNGTQVYVSYDESFTVNYNNNWQQRGVETKDGDVWEAEVVLRNGEIKKFKEIVTNK